MPQSFLENLRNRSAESRLAVAFFTTLLGAAILVPIWIWSASHTGFYANEKEVKGEVASVSSEDLSAAINEISSPNAKIDQALDEKLSEPVTALDSTVKDGSLVVRFNIVNNTFANLIVPVSLVTLLEFETDDKASTLQRITSANGGQFVPVIPAGETAEGLAYFDKVFNGNYRLKFSNLRYEAGDRAAFEQIINIQVKGAILPRQ